MISQIATGIMNKYTGSTLASNLTGGLWRDEAKQGVTFPYGVFTVISNVNEDTFTENIEFIRIQFTIWHKASSDVADVKSSLDTLESYLRGLYDYATLSITSWVNLGMYYLFSRPAYSDNEEISGVIIEYKTWITKTRA